MAIGVHRCVNNILVLFIFPLLLLIYSIGFLLFTYKFILVNKIISTAPRPFHHLMNFYLYVTMYKYNLLSILNKY